MVQLTTVGNLNYWMGQKFQSIFPTLGEQQNSEFFQLRIERI